MKIIRSDGEAATERIVSGKEGGAALFPATRQVMRITASNSCASIFQTMRIAKANDAHHFSKSCASPEKTIRIAKKSDAHRFVELCASLKKTIRIVSEFDAHHSESLMRINDPR